MTRLTKRDRQGGKSSRGLRASPLNGKRSLVGFLFGLPFFAMGAFFCWIGGLQPLFKVIESATWPTVPCIITQSEVERNSSSDGTTYRIDIQFRYSFEGHSYTGGAYDFSPGASSGYEGKRRIADSYPVGKQASCLVNPKDPEEAVLSRSVPRLIYFAIPFSSLFMVVGLGIMAASLGLLPEKWAAKVRSRHKPVSAETKGMTTLRPKVGKKGKLMGILFFAAFWNSIVGVFLFQLYKGFAEGRPEWFLLVFMIPFALVGLGLLCGVAYYLLALGNPTFTITLSEGHPRLGEEIHLEWQSSGFLGRLDSLSLELQGREAATYRRGTRSVTDHSLFHNSVVFETAQPANHAGGKAQLRIPDDSMHSFDGGSNKIEWLLRIRGSIKRWPDVDECFPLTVRPLKLN